MKIIISPAKTMKEGSAPVRDLPSFLERTELLKEEMRAMSTPQLMSVYGCSEKIAEENRIRFADMNLKENCMPALERYTGLQYRHIGWDTLSQKEKDYLQDTLRVLDAFYGILKPYDGIVSYRMDMKTRVEADGTKDLYEFWGDLPSRDLQNATVINLASNEFYTMVKPYLAPKDVITCSFVRMKDGKLKTQSTLAKSARGEMVRWMAEKRIEDPAGLKRFDRMDLVFDPEHSGDRHYIFRVKD